LPCAASVAPSAHWPDSGLRARTAYEKPTTVRKRKKAAAVARVRKQIKRSMPPKKRY
jgi:hypothetical protein